MQIFEGKKYILNSGNITSNMIKTDKGYFFDSNSEQIFNIDGTLHNNNNRIDSVDMDRLFEDFIVCTNLIDDDKLLEIHLTTLDDFKNLEILDDADTNITDEEICICDSCVKFRKDLYENNLNALILMFSILRDHLTEYDPEFNHSQLNRVDFTTVKVSDLITYYIEFYERYMLLMENNVIVNLPDNITTFISIMLSVENDYYVEIINKIEDVYNKRGPIPKNKIEFVSEDEKINNEIKSLFNNIIDNNNNIERYRTFNSDEEYEIKDLHYLIKCLLKDIRRDLNIKIILETENFKKFSKLRNLKAVTKVYETLYDLYTGTEQRETRLKFIKITAKIINTK